VSKTYHHTTGRVSGVTPAWRRQADDFSYRLVRMKEEAFRLGLYRTGHAMDVATRKVGWELADILTGKQFLPKATVTGPLRPAAKP